MYFQEMMNPKHRLSTTMMLLQHPLSQHHNRCCRHPMSRSFRMSRSTLCPTLTQDQPHLQHRPPALVSSYPHHSLSLKRSLWVWNRTSCNSKVKCSSSLHSSLTKPQKVFSLDSINLLLHITLINQEQNRSFR